MKRKTKPTASRIWEFGAVMIVDGKLCRGGVKDVPEPFATELRFAHRYRNKLVELTKREQDGYREIRRRYAPDVERLEADLEAMKAAREQLDDYAKAQHKAEMARRIAEAKAEGKLPPKTVRVKLPEVRAWQKALRALRKETVERLREQREQYDTPVDRVEEWYKAAATVRAEEMGFGPRDQHGKGRANAAVLEEMLADPNVPQAWKDVKQAEVQIGDERQLARAWSDVQSGTKGLTEKAVESAVMSVADKRKQGEMAELQFRRFEGDGRVGAHFSGGITWEELEAKSVGFRVRRVERSTEPHQSKRHACRAEYDVWMPAEPGRGPRCAVFRVVMHRPLPPSARVKDVWVLARKRGIKTRFVLQLSLELQPGAVKRERGERGTAAIHFAWRRTEGGLRVAHLDADVPIMMAGRDIRGEILVPEKVEDDLHNARELRAVSDEIWNGVREHAIAWVQGGKAPERIVQGCRTIPHWRNPVKLAKLLEEHARELSGGQAWALWPKWLDQQIPERPHGMKWSKWMELRKKESLNLFGDPDEVRSWAEAQGAVDPDAVMLLWWARKHLHLADWAERSRTRGQKHRDHWYRNVVAATRRSVRTCIVDAQNLREAGKKTRPTDDGTVGSHVRNQKKDASPGRLRGLFAEVFGDDFEKCELDGIASTCHVCAAPLKESTDLVVSCENDHVHDRDVNVTQQMLDREWRGDDGIPGGARAGEISEENSGQQAAE